MTSRLRTLLGCAALLLASAFGTAGVASAQSINITGCASLSAPVVSGNNITITCNPNVSQPGSPTCSGANLSGTGPLTFTATCSAGGANPITSITLSSGQTFCSAATTPCGASPISVSIPGIAVPGASTNYVVTARDSVGATGTASAFYSVSTGGGGAVDLSACAAMGYPNAAYYDSAYPSGSNINQSNVFHAATPSGMPFGNSSALVVRFTTPALGVNDATGPNFQAWASGSNNNHQATIGTAPCLVPTANSNLPADWAHASGAGVLKTVLSQTPSFTVLVTADGLCNLGASCPNASTVFLRPNATYYITLVNKSASWTGTPNCSTGDCDMRFNFNN